MSLYVWTFGTGLDILQASFGTSIGGTTFEDVQSVRADGTTKTINREEEEQLVDFSTNQGNPGKIVDGRIEGVTGFAGPAHFETTDMSELKYRGGGIRRVLIDCSMGYGGACECTG